MPCPKCNSKRLFRHTEVVCPNCQNIKTADLSAEISQRKMLVETLEKQLYMKLNACDQSVIFILAQRSRESISRKIVKDPWSYINEMQTWHAISYILEKCKTDLQNGKNANESIDDLIAISKEVTRLKNEIGKLETQQATVIKIEDKKEFCLTEDFPLSFVPKAVENDIKATLGIDYSNFDQWTGEVKNDNVETILTQSLAMDPASKMVRSEIINRHLRFTSNSRIFPSLNCSTKSKKFVEMSTMLSEQLLMLAWDTLANNSIIEIDKSRIYTLGEFGKAYSSAEIDWYLGLMKKFILYNQKNGLVYVPFFTIQMFKLAVFKWSGLPEVGKELNYIGETVEELIFNLVQSFDAETSHPITKEPLIRVINPALKEEIADVMIYNAKHIVLIESKFWDCPHLQDLEDQLVVFEKKVEFFRHNCRQLGFPEAEIVSVFCTPFPPYSVWNGIQLIPSQFLIGVFLSKFFKPKKPALIEEDERLRKLVLSQDYPIPYPIDAHELDNGIPANSMRIHDGKVINYDEREIEIEIMNPFGQSFAIILDITTKTFEELKKHCISAGNLVRFGAINHSGSWSITQFLYFEKIDEKNPERKVKEILGNTELADEVIGVFQKHNLDIFKFIDFCKKRTPTSGLLSKVVAARLGTVLHISDSYDFVAQCECGQIIGLHKAFVEQRKAISGGKILCQSCLKQFLE